MGLIGSAIGAVGSIFGGITRMLLNGPMHNVFLHRQRKVSNNVTKLPPEVRRSWVEQMKV